MTEAIDATNLLGKEKITEILNRRHKEREIQLQAAKLERQKDADETEALEYFESSFDEKANLIQRRLDQLATEGLAKTAPQVFSDLQNETYELQRYLTTSTLFLSEYKIKVCQNTINELCKRQEALRNELIPKKKFGFKNKKTAKLLQNAEMAREGLLSAGPATVGKNSADSEDRMQWTFTNRTQEIITLPKNKIDEQTITASNLTNCIVRLEGHPGSLQFAKLENCLVICGPTARSIFLDDCVRCKFVVACQQLRCHRSRSCDLYLKVTSRAIIEDCSEIRVAEYNAQYATIRDDLAQSGLDPEANNWNELDDFNWLATDKPSPNWFVLDAEQIVHDWTRYEEKFQADYALCKS